ncbi:MAG: M48 family metallopeptidase [Subdoligranulum sp.]
MPIRRARCGRCQAKSADNTGCLIEHFGNADAVPQLPERCLSRKAGIVRCCPKSGGGQMNQPDPQRRIAGGVEYELTRRRVRNLNIRVRTDGSVAVSAPRRVPLSSVDAFVAAHAGWVAAAQDRMAVHMANRAAEPPLPSKAIALHQMQALCAQYYPLFAATCPRGEMPRIAVRDMSTRWGSCSLKTGTLCFALRLCVMPLPAQEYVVVHEFCHFAHPNHSPAFWGRRGQGDAGL